MSTEHRKQRIGAVGKLQRIESCRKKDTGIILVRGPTET